MKKISKKAFNLAKVSFVLLAVLICGVYYLIFADNLVPKVKDEISFEITIEETSKALLSNITNDIKEKEESIELEIKDDDENIDYQEIKNKSSDSEASIEDSEQYDTEEDVDANSDNNDGLVNINTASSDLLQTLKNIGPAVAKNIIDYRENIGAFNTIEDIMNVKGIGQGKFDTIKDSITVND